MKRAIIVRHGQTKMNALPKKQAILNGSAETSLTRLGRAQCAQAATRILRYKQSIIRAVSSALYRAIDSRDIMIQSLGIDPLTIETAAFNERSLGEFEGMLVQDVLADPWFGTNGLGKDFRRSFSVHAPGGENYTDVTNRVVPAYFEQLEQIESEETLLVVAHGHVNRCLIGNLLNLTESDIVRLQISNSDPLIIEHTQSGARLSETNGNQLFFA